MRRMTFLVAAAVAIMVGGVFAASIPTVTHASHGHALKHNLNTHVTLSVYTCCGSLEGFNDSNPAHLFSVHNIYHKLWAKKFPGLKFKETLINDPAQVQTKLALAINAGTPPDMVFINGFPIGFVVLRKQAQPLDKYFKQYKTSDSYFLPSMAKWAHFGGHWWAIPAVSGPQAGQLVYIPKYMSPLGYNNSNLKTWNDLYAMSKKAVKIKGGNLERIGYWPGAGPGQNTWGNTSRLMCAPGHGLYNSKNEPTANDPCNVKWLTFLKKLSDLYGGYAKVAKFLSGDPDIWSGSKKDYMATGKALISPSASAYWSITPFDNFNFGFKQGLNYQLTPLPPTVHGTLSEASNFPSTQQEIIIPPGAKNPDVAFAVSKMICWDYGYLLGPTTNGSVVAKDQNKWLQSMIKGEGIARKKAKLPGNPAATLKGLKDQPMLARNAKAHGALNPIDPYYVDQLSKYTDRVLYGQMSPKDALDAVQKLAVSYEARLKSQYGAWNW